MKKLFTFLVHSLAPILTTVFILLCCFNPTEISAQTTGFTNVTPDKDHDGFGDRMISYSLMWSVGCVPPFGGELRVDNGLDCNDNDADINPNTVWYRDADGDGYTDGTTIIQCTRPDHYLLYSEVSGGVFNGVPRVLDCDDTDPTVNVQDNWFPDPDNDGYIYCRQLQRLRWTIKKDLQATGELGIPHSATCKWLSYRDRI